MMYFLKPAFMNQLANALREVRNANPNGELTVIAGGCMRDHWCGKPVKDIDVFIRTDRSVNDVLEDLRQRFPKAEMEFNLEYRDLDVTGVIHLGLSYGLMPVQVILLRQGDTLEEIVERIDMGICQIGWDGERVYTTQAFAKDVREQTMTVVRVDSNGEERSLRRFERLSEKYPGFRFVSSLQPLDLAA